MENRAHALAAGAFLLALSLAAAAALWWLSGKRDFTRDYVLVSTGNVTGLNPEAQVRYRGMRAGKVQDIELDPADRRNILVTIRIDADLPITRSTRAQLAVQGITGLAYVQLSDSGASKQALAAGEDGLVRLPLEPSQWDQLSESAAGLIAQVRMTASRIDAVLDPRNVDSMTRTLARIESASAAIESAARSMPEAVAEARRLLSEVKPERVRAILANLEVASAQAGPAAVAARALVARMESLVARLDALG
ncbi:MAG TPA: MCE family protein, partial [Rhodocyclaceae bacterium]|nr:MCE family protein [Rhodocyclaceae bacterium]